MEITLNDRVQATLDEIAELAALYEDCDNGSKGQIPAHCLIAAKWLVQVTARTLDETWTMPDVLPALCQRGLALSWEGASGSTVLLLVTPGEERGGVQVISVRTEPGSAPIRKEVSLGEAVQYVAAALEPVEADVDVDDRDTFCSDIELYDVEE